MEIKNLTKTNLVVLLSLFILGIILSLSPIGCNKEAITVTIKDSGSLPIEGIPEIDASAPIVTETATFALG